MSTPSEETALVLGCHPPRHDSRSSRLAAALGPRLACLVEWAMLECSLEDLLAWPGPRFMLVSHGNEAWAEEVAMQRATVLSGAGGTTLGRLGSALQCLRRSRVEPWIFINGPAPTMSRLCLDAAAGALARGTSAIGSSADGKLALLGMATDPDPIAHVDLERATAASRVSSLLAGAGGKLTHVNPGVRIECAADIGICQREVEQDERPSRARLRFLLGALADDIASSRSHLAALQREQCEPMTAPVATATSLLASTAM